jgi:hypothetical protein
MALPRARKIVVDGKSYEWIVKNRRGSGTYEEDTWGNDQYVIDRKLTVRNPENGKVVQKEFATTVVASKAVGDLIRESLARGIL